jgi:hypothetical protein
MTALREPCSFHIAVRQPAQRTTQWTLPLSVGTFTNSRVPARTDIAENSTMAWCAKGPPVSRWQRVQ